MKIKLLILFALLFCAPVFGQNESSYAKRIKVVATLPATCFSGTVSRDVVFKTGASAGFYSCTSANTWTSASGSSGTVTSVSVVTANGVSGSVATATTTPAITLTLGNITPTTVTTTGTLGISGATTTGPDVEVSITGDTFARAAMGINTTDIARVSFGPGNAARDLFIERAANATVRWGAPDAAAAVAQIDTVQNVVAGTSNTAGANRTYKGSAGTGTGIGGSIIWAVAPAGSTGTTQNTFVNAMTLNSASQLSIGLGTTAPPAGPLLVVGDTSTSSPRGIMSVQVNTGTDGARFHLRKARGTFASPTVIVSGDTLGKLVASGYDGTNFLEMGAIEIDATGTIASTRVPTKMVFSTATDAAPSVLTAALTIDKDQSVTAANSVLAGSAYINTWPVSASYAVFQNNSLAKTNGNQALIQNTDGHSELNSASGKVLNFTQASVVKAQLTTGGDFAPGSAGLISLGNSTTGWKQLFIDQTITAGGTTGDRTINKAAGTVNIAASGTSVTVTNNLCTTSSIVLAVIRTNDTTATIKNVVPGAGSFVITLGAASTAEVSIGFLVINQ